MAKQVGTSQSAGAVSRPLYRDVLRAIGAHADLLDRGRLTLMETPEGYEVIIEHPDSTPRRTALHFSLAGASNGRERPKKAMQRNRDLAECLVAGTSHQDILRAIGHELDRAQAHNILLDELDDRLLVTYGYVDPQRGFHWRKRSIVLTQGEIGQILMAARGRRRRSLFQRWFQDDDAPQPSQSL